MTPSNLLVLRPGAIGDTLLTMPSLAALRGRFPGAEITVVGNQAPLSLGHAAGFLDRHDAFGAAWVSDLFGDEPTPALRTRLDRFDLGIVWMHAVEAASDLAARLERAGVREALPLVSFPEPRSGRHLADHLVDTLLPLGITGPRPAVTLRPGVERPHPLPAPLAVFHPGAGGRHKRWPGERFAALADRFAASGWDVAVTRGPADEDAVAIFRSRLLLANPADLGGLPLDELARILTRASLFVGNDSGMTHLAALLDVPTVAIFGPFDPSYWAPIGRYVEVVDAGRSCPHRFDPREGCRQCAVLAGLDPGPVWEAAQAVLATASRDRSPSACP